LFAVPIFFAIFLIRPRITNCHQRQESLTQSISSCEKQALPSSGNLFRKFYQCLTGIFWTYIFMNTIQSTVFYLPGLYLPSKSVGQLPIPKAKSNLRAFSGW
jgi:hypothetical protein